MRKSSFEMSMAFLIAKKASVFGENGAAKLSEV